jgi:hypothetical protein
VLPCPREAAARRARSPARPVADATTRRHWPDRLSRKLRAPGPSSTARPQPTTTRIEDVSRTPGRRRGHGERLPDERCRQMWRAKPRRRAPQSWTRVPVPQAEGQTRCRGDRTTATQTRSWFRGGDVKSLVRFSVAPCPHTLPRGPVPNPYRHPSVHVAHFDQRLAWRARWSKGSRAIEVHPQEFGEELPRGSVHRSLTPFEPAG